MAYTPNAEDTAQPTGNQALSTAALEFRTLKTYIQATKIAQAAATRSITNNLTSALITQNNRDNAQDIAIADATNIGITASVIAGTKVNKAVLTGSGNWVVPAGVTRILAIVQGGGSCEAEYSANNWGGNNWSFYSEPTAGELVVASVAVTAGDSIAYVCGVGQEVHRDPTTGSAWTLCYMKSFIDAGDSYFYSPFETVRARAAISRYAVNVGGTVSRYGSNFGFSGHYTGKLPDTQIANVAYTPNTITQIAGKAGSITLLY